MRVSATSTFHPGEGGRGGRPGVGGRGNHFQRRRSGRGAAAAEEGLSRVARRASDRAARRQQRSKGCRDADPITYLSRAPVTKTIPPPTRPRRSIALDGLLHGDPWLAAAASGEGRGSDKEASKRRVVPRSYTHGSSVKCLTS